MKVPLNKKSLNVGQQVITVRGRGIVTEINSESNIRVRLNSGEVHTFGRERISNLQALSVFLSAQA